MRPGPGTSCASSAWRRSPRTATGWSSTASARCRCRAPGERRGALLARAGQEAAGCLRDGGGVDAVVAVEILARAGLAEVVHAEGELGHAEGGADEGERVRVAVEHGD